MKLLGFWWEEGFEDEKVTEEIGLDSSLYWSFVVCFAAATLRLCHGPWRLMRRLSPMMKDVNVRKSERITLLRCVDIVVDKAVMTTLDFGLRRPSNRSCPLLLSSLMLLLLWEEGGAKHVHVMHTSHARHYPFLPKGPLTSFYTTPLWWLVSVGCDSRLPRIQKSCWEFWSLCPVLGMVAGYPNPRSCRRWSLFMSVLLYSMLCIFLLVLSKGWWGDGEYMWIHDKFLQNVNKYVWAYCKCHWYNSPFLRT